MLEKERGPEADGFEASTSDSIAAASDVDCTTSGKASGEVVASFDGVPALTGAWVADESAFDAVAAAMERKAWSSSTVEALDRLCQGQTGASRVRAWTCIAYPESMAANALGLLESSSWQGVFSPLHDRDRWPDGTLKKPHFHVILYTGGKCTYAKVAHVCKELRFTPPQPVDNLGGLCRYFLHLDIDPEHVPGDVGKVRYEREDAVPFGGFDFDQFLRMTATQVGKVVSSLEALLREHEREVEAWWSSEHGEGEARPRDVSTWADFRDWIAEERPELLYLSAEPQVAQAMYRYIHSRTSYRVMVRDAERFAERVERMDNELSEVKGYLKGLDDKGVFDGEH